MRNSMIDRHYYIRSDQDRALKALSKRLNIKPAQLVRQGIDMLLQDHNDSNNWLDETRKIRGLLKDDTNIDQRIADARTSLERNLNFAD